MRLCSPGWLSSQPCQKVAPRILCLLNAQSLEGTGRSLEAAGSYARVWEQWLMVPSWLSGTRQVPRAVGLGTGEGKEDRTCVFLQRGLLLPPSPWRLPHYGVLGSSGSPCQKLWSWQGHRRLGISHARVSSIELPDPPTAQEPTNHFCMQNVLVGCLLATFPGWIHAT